MWFVRSENTNLKKKLNPVSSLSPEITSRRVPCTQFHLRIHPRNPTFSTKTRPRRRSYRPLKIISVGHNLCWSQELWLRGLCWSNFGFYQPGIHPTLLYKGHCSHCLPHGWSGARAARRGSGPLTFPSFPDVGKPSHIHTHTKKKMVEKIQVSTFLTITPATPLHTERSETHPLPGSLGQL